MLALLLATALWAQVDDPEAKRLEQREAYLQESAKQKEDELAFLQYRIKTSQSKRGQAMIRKEFRELKRSKELFVPRLALPLAVGQIGRLPQQTPLVVQVVDAENCIVQSNFRTLVFRSPPPTWALGFVEEWLWIESVPTGEFRDNRAGDFPQVFEISGNRTYTTVDGGSKTVFVVRPIDLDELLAEPQEADDSSPERAPAPP